MAQASGGAVPLRTRLAVYGAGFFAEGGTHVVIPLWLLALDTSPFMFGLVIGARSFLPLLFSIHGGTLMDRLGARRVMLFFAAVTLVLPFLFPILPWVWAALVLSMLAGMTTTMQWVGAQTMVGTAMKGNPVAAGWLSFSNRAGSLVCPLIAGVAWDVFGPWGGFGVMAIWAVGMLISAGFLPSSGEGDKPVSRFNVGDIMPRPADYVAAFRILAIPTVAMVVIAAAINIASGAVQASFYIAYLENIGFTGTLIGALISVNSIGAACGTLLTGRLVRWFRSIDLMNLVILISTAALAITPFFTTFLPLLVVITLRGLGQGVSQPLFLSISAKSVPQDAQGATVGLRITMNRVVQTFLPILMGVIVEIVGLDSSFFVVGGILVALISLFTVVFWGRREVAAAPEGGGARL